MGTAKAKPYNYVCRLLFQAQICGTVNPVDLFLERLTTHFPVTSQSMPVFLNKYVRTALCSKLFTQFVVVWMSIRILCTLASPQPLAELQTTEAIVFQPLQKVYVSCYLSFWQTTARMLVWNLQGSIGFLYITFLKPIAKLF